MYCAILYAVQYRVSKCLARPSEWSGLYPVLAPKKIISSNILCSIVRPAGCLFGLGSKTSLICRWWQRPKRGHVVQQVAEDSLLDQSGWRNGINCQEDLASWSTVLSVRWTNGSRMRQENTGKIKLRLNLWRNFIVKFRMRQGTEVTFNGSRVASLTGLFEH